MSPAELGAMASAALPPRALVGFKRVALKPGEERTVEFTVTPYQLGGAFMEKGRYNVAREITLRAAPNSGAAGVSQKVMIAGEPALAEYKMAAPRVLQGDAQP
jgi:hypothetical protein